MCEWCAPVRLCVFESHEEECNRTPCSNLSISFREIHFATRARKSDTIPIEWTMCAKQTNERNKWKHSMVTWCFFCFSFCCSPRLSSYSLRFHASTHRIVSRAFNMWTKCSKIEKQQSQQHQAKEKRKKKVSVFSLKLNVVLIFRRRPICRLFLYNNVSLSHSVSRRHTHSTGLTSIGNK